MNRRAIAIGEIAVAILLIVIAVLSWAHGVRPGGYPADGELPAFSVDRYVGPWLLLAALLVATGAVVLIDAAARLVRR